MLNSKRSFTLKEEKAILFYREYIIDNPNNVMFYSDLKAFKKKMSKKSVLDIVNTLNRLKLVHLIENTIGDFFIFKRNINISGRLREIKNEYQLNDYLSFSNDSLPKSFEEKVISLYDNYIIHVEFDKPFSRALIDKCINCFHKDHGSSPLFNNLNDSEIILYILIITSFCRDLRRITDLSNLEDLISYNKAHLLIKSLRNKESALLKNNLIEIAYEDENSMDTNYSLTIVSKKLLGIKFNENATYFNIQNPKEIKKNNLVFNDSFHSKIKNLESIITSYVVESEVKSIKVLFFGDPGTGKTTLCQNLAISSNRKLLTVNGSKLLSMWADETPKNIDRLFDEYEKLSKNLNRIPILFFDECDQIVTKRTNSSNSSYKSDENKTIIRLMRRLDGFEGILIFASNLFNEIDPALNDRFLFKLKFENPDSKIKEKIFIEKFKFLKKYNLSIENISNKYEDLNPRQIENIKRKLYLMERVNIKKISVESLIEEELLIENKFKRVKIGFCNT